MVQALACKVAAAVAELAEDAVGIAHSDNRRSVDTSVEADVAEKGHDTAAQNQDELKHRFLNPAGAGWGQKLGGDHM